MFPHLPSCWSVLQELKEKHLSVKLTHVLGKDNDASVENIVK